MWDLATGTDSVTLPDGVGEDVTLAFSPDGNLLAAPNTDTNIRVWNSQTGSLMATLGQLPLAIFGLVFSADGQHMAGAGVDRAIYIWNTGTWELERRLEGQPEMITALALSRDGSVLVAGGFNEFSSMNPVKVLVWDVANRTIIRSFDAPHAVISAAVSPGGKSIAAAAVGKSVQVWQLR